MQGQVSGGVHKDALMISLSNVIVALGTQSRGDGKKNRADKSGQSWSKYNHLTYSSASALEGHLYNRSFDFGLVKPSATRKTKTVDCGVISNVYDYQRIWMLYWFYLFKWHLKKKLSVLRTNTYILESDCQHKPSFQWMRKNWARFNSQWRKLKIKKELNSSNQDNLSKMLRIFCIAECKRSRRCFVKILFFLQIWKHWTPC